MRDIDRCINSQLFNSNGDAVKITKEIDYANNIGVVTIPIEKDGFYAITVTIKPDMPATFTNIITNIKKQNFSIMGGVEKIDILAELSDTYISNSPYNFYSYSAFIEADSIVSASVYLNDETRTGKLILDVVKRD